MIEEVQQKVYELLNNDNSGHGMEHINRVLELSLKFAKIENANKDIVTLIALLHDVDDYKLFGMNHAENLTNAKKIMSDCNIDKNIFPIVNLSADKYTSRCADSSVCHIFEKILKLKNLMLTDAGKKEAINRHQIIVDFLYHLFSEENALDWIEYLDNYLKNN